MMASFLPVIVSKKNKEKYAFYYSVSQILINSEKKPKKNHQNDFFERPYLWPVIYAW